MFNKIRYIELLKKNQSLENENTSLDNKNKLEYSELLSYDEVVYDQIIYNRKHDYIFLIERYLTNEIDSFVLKCHFFQTQREDRKIHNDLKNNFQQLSNLSIDSKSSKFSLLVEDIFEACEALKYYDDPEEVYGINELQFRVFLEKTFLQIEKYSDK